MSVLNLCFYFLVLFIAYRTGTQVSTHTHIEMVRRASHAKTHCHSLQNAILHQSKKEQNTLNMLYVFCVLVFGKARATIQIQHALAQPCFLHASALYPALPHSYDLCLAVCPVAGEEHWCYMTRNPQTILDSSIAGLRQSKLRHFCCFCTFLWILCAFVISLCAHSIWIIVFISGGSSCIIFAVVRSTLLLRHLHLRSSVLS